MAAIWAEGLTVGRRPEPPTCCCSWARMAGRWQEAGRPRLGPPPQSCPAPSPRAQPLRARLLLLPPAPSPAPWPPWICLCGSPLYVCPLLCLSVSVSLSLLFSVSFSPLFSLPVPLSVSASACLCPSGTHTHTRAHRTRQSLPACPTPCIYTNLFSESRTACHSIARALPPCHACPVSFHPSPSHRCTLPHCLTTDPRSTHTVLQCHSHGAPQNATPVPRNLSEGGTCHLAQAQTSYLRVSPCAVSPSVTHNLSRRPSHTFACS